MNSDKSPEILDYRNANGHGWRFYRSDGVLRKLLPNQKPEDDMKTIRHVQNLKLRDDDVMIVAYPKCGTHWLWEIVHMIQSGRVQYSRHKKEVAMLGMPQLEKAHELPSPRILNSHFYFRHLPGKLVERRIKTIHILRNPKDVSVSFFHHFSGLKPPTGFEGSYLELTDLFLEGKVPCDSYFDYIKDWLQVERDHPQLPVLTLHYEELKKEPVKTIKKVAEFLDQPISDDLCAEIAEACSFTKLKTVDKDVKERLSQGSSPFKDGHIGMYRKGEIGDWKNWLTVAQNKRFDDAIEEEMKGTGIVFNYE